MKSFLHVLSTLAGCLALDIQVSSTGGNATSGYQYGIMFEDINQSGDGGIYAELIRNRAFQGDSVFPSTVEPWTPVGDATLSLQNLSQPLSSALPTSLRVTASSGTVGISNPGYWGIDVKEQNYSGSFWVSGNYKGSFTASLYNYLSNETLGTVQVLSNDTASGWVEYTYTLVPDSAADNVNNTLRITYDASQTSGSLDFNLISLFPPTYNNRPNGLRVDLMEALGGLNPSFLRFPGGNNLEGEDPPYYLKWNETIGPLKDRPGYPGTWTYENTNGLGLVEYLHWCDDLNMEPVLAVWAGFYLDGPVISEADLQPYIDDALNELEFIMGDTSTTYGALRASLGYPDPWTIRYVEIGNEDNLSNGGSSYEAYRYQAFKDAINEKYPDILVMASTAAYNFTETENAGEDYHQYTRPDYFVGQFNFFDNHTEGFKTMIGEYAAVQPNIPEGGGVNWSDPKWMFPEWIGTVSEAVFLIGAERNADKIFGAAYAPTLQNLNSYQWSPDLISYTADPDEDVLSTSYHMIQLFSSHRITNTLPIDSPAFGPAYYVAGYSNTTDSYLLKTAVYNATEAVNATVTFAGVSEGATGTLTVLTAPDPESYNSVGSDVVVKTESSVTAGSGGVFQLDLPDLSVSLLEVTA
ncbi:glycoside hydrolase family 51 protein [Lophiostoma macrostomum CBS 122681]|uniref:non-reducing end alpha-L-arabinofuranosidase n=1 Tax=Lophiostoma macrostomum CBS 122681 TaxID=1314788 RepID=A0A6A6T9U6_9PLEO|nr:glycoside hydrolase family 51 protein [Lophiostoma macrostomum CBS 122681]